MADVVATIFFELYDWPAYLPIAYSGHPFTSPSSYVSLSMAKSENKGTASLLQ